jgi:hypothetical protein
MNKVNPKYLGWNLYKKPEMTQDPEQDEIHFI